MAFEQRREYLFVYSVKDANPNGDPLNANHPRMDEDSGQILVSDVRVKRTVRDELIRQGKDVFVDGEPKTLRQRIEELKATLSEKTGKEVKTGKEALAQCIDTRLFGVTFALGSEAFAWTGPVQFKWGRSLHRATVQMIQGTAAFATGDNKVQKSFRNEYIVPFVLIADYAIANQHAAKTTGATDEDLDALFEALWKGTGNLITRSKVGHMPRFLMEVHYAEGFDGIIGAMDEKIELLGKGGEELSADEQRAVRSCEDVLLDVGPLAEGIRRHAGSIESARVVRDAELEVARLDEIEKVLGGKLRSEVR